MFDPKTIQEWRAIAPFCSTEKLDDYVAQGKLRSVVHNTYNHDILGSNYGAESATRRVYIFGEYDLHEMIVAERYPWNKITDIEAGNIAQIAGYGMQLEPRIPGILTDQNDGVMPPILPPKALPVPAPVEIPVDPEQPTEPEVDESAAS